MKEGTPRSTPCLPVTSSICANVFLCLSGLLMLLSVPVLIFGGFVLEYFYQVHSFSVVSEWFNFLPTCFYTCAAMNLLSTCLLPTTRVCSKGTVKTLASIFVTIVYLVAAAINGVSTFACMELRSIILQQNFLSVDKADVLVKYLDDVSFRHEWDNLQRRYFCCGTFNYNFGYKDWKSFYGNNSVPDSCCHQESYGCGTNIFLGAIPPTSIYVHGCLAVIQSKLEQELTMVLAMFTIIQVLLVLLHVTSLIMSLCHDNDRDVDKSKGVKIIRSNLERKHEDVRSNVVKANEKDNSDLNDIYTTRISSEV